MRGYLLSTQSLLDRLSGRSIYAVSEWLDRQVRAATEVRVSVVSFGLAQAAIDALDDAALRARFHHALDQTRRSLPRHARLTVDEDTMPPWATLMAVPAALTRYGDRINRRAEVELGDAELLVVATALARDLTLVEPSQPYHEVLASYGLETETLGE